MSTFLTFSSQTKITISVTSDTDVITLNVYKLDVKQKSLKEIVVGGEKKQLEIRFNRYCFGRKVHDGNILQRNISKRPHRFLLKFLQVQNTTG